MEKIKNSEVNKFNEWCCGKELKNDYLCGDHYNKNHKVICDDCLLNLKVRKAKIESLRKEMTKLTDNHIISERAFSIGYNNMQDSLLKEIKRLENRRD